MRSASNGTVLSLGAEEGNVHIILEHEHSSYFYSDYNGTYAYPVFANPGVIFATGNLSISGTKNFLISHPEKSDSFIKYIATESPRSND